MQKERIKIFSAGIVLLFVCTVNAVAISTSTVVADVVEESTSAVSASTVTLNVDIYADEMIYNNETEVIVATGNVKIYYGDMELYAGNMEYKRKEDHINAWGNVNFSKENYTLTADTMNYHIHSSTGIVYKTSIKSPPFFIYADEVVIRDKDEFFIPVGDFTTCSDRPPHYKFNGRNIKLKLNSRISAYSTLFFIRGLPVCYYPYYTKKLGPRKMELNIDIGSSSRDGNFIKTRCLYPFTENSKTYAGIDYMKKRGLGLKAGHSYNTSNGYSDVDLYYIRDKEMKTDSGKFYAKGWQEIIDKLSIRYRTEYTSYYKFNYEYNQLGYEYKKQELYYQLGFDYLTSKYIISMYGDKKEEWDNEQYSVRNLILPGMKFQLFPIYIPGKLRFQGSTEYRNEYQPDSEKWQTNITWVTRIDKSYRLNINRYYYVTMAPGFGLDGEYRDSLKRYGSMFLSMQHGLYRSIFVTGNYLLRKRIEYPYTISNNILSYNLEYNYSSKFMISSGSSYDFRKNIEKPVGDFLTRSRLKYRGYKLYVRNRYDYYEKISKEWLCEININSFSESRIRYNFIYPGRLEIGQRFVYSRRPYVFSAGVRFYMSKEKGFYSFDEFIEKHLSIRRNLHCWDGELRIVNRGEETVFWVLFNISAFPESKIGLYANPLYKDYRYIRE